MAENLYLIWNRVAMNMDYGDELRDELKAAGYTQELHYRFSKVIHGNKKPTPEQLTPILAPIRLFYERRMGFFESQMEEARKELTHFEGRLTPLFGHRINQDMEDILATYHSNLFHHYNCREGCESMITSIDDILSPPSSPMAKILPLTPRKP